MAPRCSAHIRGRDLANVCLANEQVVRPLGTRLNKNAARESETGDRTPRNSPADRMRFFCPNLADDLRDDPRSPCRAEGWEPFPVSPADELASDAIVPGVELALSHWNDTAVGLSTAASNAPRPGTFRCNSDGEHSAA